MLKNALIICAGSFLVVSCAAIELDPHASRVLVSPNPPAKECKYLGQVYGNQGNFFTGSWTSNKNLEVGAMNDMKNQASKMGANYIQLITSRSGNTGSVNNGFGNMEQTNVTNVGNAFYCAKVY